MKLLTIVCTAALVVAFAVPALAETQNVKISGDINLWTLARRGFSLDENDNTTNSWDTTTVFMQQVGVNVAADLTDKVSTYIRVIDERDWDVANATNMDIGIDEAYITLGELLYAPLTVKIGRQNMWFGKGFIVGNSGVTNWDHEGNLTAAEISDMTAFDAIRGTLDYDPWTIDLVAAKIDENLAASSDDIDLYGLNIGYLFDKNEAEAETYYWYQSDRSDRGLQVAGANKANQDGTNTIHCIGVRGSMVPYDYMNIYGEIAGQWGKIGAVDSGQVNDERMDRDAWALDIGADYTFADIKWTPLLGAEYIFYSGQEAEASGSNWAGWNALYRGKFDSQIREYQNILYNDAFGSATRGGAAATAAQIAAYRARNNGSTNQHQAIIRGVIDPMEDVKVDANINFFWLDEDLERSTNNALPDQADNDSHIGTEVDAKVTYDYTEDVKFQVMGGIFWPGDVYPGDQDDTASQVAARCAVEF